MNFGEFNELELNQDTSTAGVIIRLTIENQKPTHRLTVEGQ